MGTLPEIETQIAALEKRHAELDAKLVKHGKFDADVMDAMSVVDKQLKDLRPRRSSVLAGLPDPADAPVTLSVAATSPQLRPPRRMTSKEMRATAAEIHARNMEIAKSLPLDTPLEDIGELYGTEASVALTEIALHDLRDELVENGRACEFSEGIYAAFIATLWRESESTAATFLWAGNQRRLLEQRVEALESSPRQFSGSEMQRLTAYLAPQFDTAPLLKRIEELEQRSAMTYRGVWSADEQYVLGNFCTDRGSLWHCNQTTRERPGDGRAWTLAVKKGQDGKDAATRTK